jgi:hypothetical protein
MDILTNNKYFDKEKDNELICLAAFICQELINIEPQLRNNPLLKNNKGYNRHLHSLLVLRDLWINKFFLILKS